ncbi:MAG: class I SAM-dependent methyltransferase [Deltaproteobacteria bacterium]|nr:class I SAM-dependent methyltransferase [Deltaproteobacteria bacterium]
MAEYFDKQVAAYERWYTTPLGQLADQVEKQAVFALLPDLTGRRVLDAGCGTGNFSLALARRGARVVGLDRAAAMQFTARQKARKEGQDLLWVRGHLSRLPFAAATFDGVVCILALDFVAERQAALQEMVRVLRPGGFLLIAILNRYSLWTLKRTIRAWFIPSLWRQVHFLSRRDLERLLQRQPELTKPRWERAIYFPPLKSPRLVYYYPYIESLGKTLYPSLAAFLAVAAYKRLDNSKGESQT